MPEKPTNSESSGSSPKSVTDDRRTDGTLGDVTAATDYTPRENGSNQRVEVAGEDTDDDKITSPPMSSSPSKLKNTYLRVFRQQIVDNGLRADAVRALNEFDQPIVTQSKVTEEISRVSQTLSGRKTIPKISNFGGVAAIPRPDRSGWLWWRRPDVLQFNVDLLEHSQKPATPRPKFDDQDTFVIGNAAMEFQQSLNANSSSQTVDQAPDGGKQAIDEFDARKLPFIETLFTYANGSYPTFNFSEYGKVPPKEPEVHPKNQDSYKMYQIDLNIDFDWIAPKNDIKPVEDFDRILEQALELTVTEVLTIVKYAFDSNSFDFTADLKEMLRLIEGGAEYDALVDMHLMDGVNPGNLETVEIEGVVVPAEPPDVSGKAKHSPLAVDPDVTVNGSSISIDAYAVYNG